MKQMTKRRGIAILMSLAMAFTMIPMMGGLAVYARSTDDPAITIGTVVLRSTSNTSNAQIVYMADKTWKLIGYGGDGVASSADTMTLISSGNIKGVVEFRVNWEWEVADANHYSKSNLKTEVDAVANTFSDGEKAGITTRDLASGDYDGPNTDCIAGDEVKDALLWPLSTKEAYEMNGILRIVDPEHQDWATSYWWLRSPSVDAYEAPFVKGDGDIDDIGFNVEWPFGLRPAFNYDLKSVIFTSAAVGGKSSGTVGADSLAPVGTNSNDEWKLTVKDSHDAFKIDKVSTCDGKALNIRYSSAVTGNNEYISAIIKDKDGKVKYYGNLKNCTADSDASGTVKINVDGKLGEDDTLYIFNEQCNGDKKTDFSSELKEVTIPQKLHDLTKTEKVKLTCTQTGTEAYWCCEICKYMFSDEYGMNQIEEPVTIPATGHKYGEWTELDAEQHQRVCEHDATHVEKENHTWDSGKVTRRATENQAGTRTYTCTVCQATKAVTIPKLKLTPTQTPDPTPTPEPEPTPTPDPTPTPAPAEKAGGILIAKMTSKGSTGMNISWNKVNGASGYDIFLAKHNSKGKKYTCKKVKTIKGNKNFKWSKSGLKKGTAYKAYVKAYVYKNGKKTYVSTSPLKYAYTGNGTKKYTNARSVSLNKTRVTLKKGKTFKTKAKVNKVKKNKKLMPKSHVATVRYMTSDSRIATVNASGKITAKDKGTCHIHAIAHNGVSKRIKITVK